MISYIIMKNDMLYYYEKKLSYIINRKQLSSCLSR